MMICIFKTGNIPTGNEKVLTSKRLCSSLSFTFSANLYDTMATNQTKIRFVLFLFQTHQTANSKCFPKSSRLINNNNNKKNDDVPSPVSDGEARKYRKEASRTDGKMSLYRGTSLDQWDGDQKSIADGMTNKIKDRS